eukprot:TRINITY_DN62_c0_g1_i2.p1 TRINITY_DN62_c0_g1~~TRINITY_DN62_c0_g1_i2.p1  ORF type:complete len:240 (+),score=113.01 TRINITY_DN62_c0_g1_i2:56-775(+)
MSQGNKPAAGANKKQQKKAATGAAAKTASPAAAKPAAAAQPAAAKPAANKTAGTPAAAKPAAAKPAAAKKAAPAAGAAAKPAAAKKATPAAGSAPAAGAQASANPAAGAATVSRNAKKLEKRATAAKAKKQLKFVIDLTHPVEDGILDPVTFEKFLHDRIKVNGKAGNLGKAVTITREAAKINITAEAPFAKRYVKFLTKKYLKKHNLRDWLRVVSKDKTTYELRYFNIHEAEEEAGDS